MVHVRLYTLCILLPNKSFSRSKKVNSNMEQLSPTGMLKILSHYNYTGFVCWLGITLDPLREEPTVPDPLQQLLEQMSDDGLFIPQSSITIQNVVGEGKK